MPKGNLCMFVTISKGVWQLGRCYWQRTTHICQLVRLKSSDIQTPVSAPTNKHPRSKQTTGVINKHQTCQAFPNRHNISAYLSKSMRLKSTKTHMDLTISHHAAAFSLGAASASAAGQLLAQSKPTSGRMEQMEEMGSRTWNRKMEGTGINKCLGMSSTTATMEYTAMCYVYDMLPLVCGLRWPPCGFWACIMWRFWECFPWPNASLEGFTSYLKRVKVA